MFSWACKKHANKPAINSVDKANLIHSIRSKGLPTLQKAKSNFSNPQGLYPGSTIQKVAIPANYAGFAPIRKLAHETPRKGIMGIMEHTAA